MVKRSTVLLLSSLVVASCGSKASDADDRRDPLGGEALEFTELLSSECGGSYGPQERVLEIASSPEEFREYYVMGETGRMVATTPLPEVDFEASVVAVAISEPLGQCGHELLITGVRDTGAAVEIEVTLRRYCAGDDAESNAYTFASIPRLDKPYVFVEKLWTEPCGD